MPLKSTLARILGVVVTADLPDDIKQIIEHLA
jgi:hypothetical protein